MASFRLSFSSSPTQNTPIPLYLSQKAASATIRYPAGAPHAHVPTVQTLRPLFEVKAQNSGGVCRYTSWALVQHGGRGSRPQNRGIPTFPTRPFLSKSLEKPRKRLPIDINRRSSRRRKLRRDVGSARLIASSTDHAAIIKRILSAPTHRENVIRLGRIRKPRPLVIEKAMTERTVSHAAILRLGKDPLPPVEVLSCPRARHPRPSRRLSEGLRLR